MRLGYNTNGLAHHNVQDAVRLLADLGYESVAITLDHGALNPFVDTATHAREVAEMAALLDRLNMHSVIETGARFLLDPRQKHEPTLVSPTPESRQVRIDFLCRAIRVAGELKSDCVSFWSGVVHDDAPRVVARARLIAALEEVLPVAERAGVPIGFEPEPGMLVDTMKSFAQLQAKISSPALRLTLDVGHLHCQGETPLPAMIERWGSELMNVHLEDMRAGVHEHLMFGEGEMDFPPILAALAATGYDGGVHVELSRHSHQGPTAARAARDFLRPMWPR